MKFVCSQSDLNSHLSLVSRAIPSKPTHPILGNVLLIANEEVGRVYLRAFDLNLGIQTSFPAQVDDGGEITVPAKALNDIVSRLPEGEITFSHDATEAFPSDDEEMEEDEDNESQEQTIVTLTSTSGKYELRSLNAAEYPALPEVEEGEWVSLPVQALIEGLRSTLFAASTEETKQVLTGVHVTLKKDSIEFAATDGHRLAVVETPRAQEENAEGSEELDEDSEENTEENTEEESTFNVTIPARSLRELERMLGMSGAQEDLITLHLDDTIVVFELGERKLTSRRLEGAYPDYQQLIPQVFKNKISLDRRQLISSLERISVLADSKNNVVKWTLNKDNQEILLSVESKSLGTGKEALRAEIDNTEPPQIAFNVKYLMDGLKSLPSSDITIHLNSAMQPVIFKPLSGLKMTYLAMPVQLRE